MKPDRLGLLALALFPLSYQITQAQIPVVGQVGQAQVGFQFTEGPAVDAQGYIYFSDVQRKRTHKVDTAG